MKSAFAYSGRWIPEYGDSIGERYQNDRQEQQYTAPLEKVMQ